MPSPLEAAGAAVQPIAAAPLHTNEFFTGLWTNGSPLGPGAVPYLYAKSYGGARYDRLVNGNDIEISPRLTLIRRPGHTVYNPGPFPPINRFYEFRGFTATDEILHLMADCDAGTGSASPTVREVTQPSTNSILWTKSAGAGRTSFVSDGNVLYAGDGTATHQWVTSAKGWLASTLYQPGDFIVDTNNNVQMAVGSVTANIVNIQVDDVGSGNRRITWFFSAATPFDVPNNIMIVTSGQTTVPSANISTAYALQVQSTLQSYVIGPAPSIPVTPFSPETGQATTGTGITGSSAPVWNTNLGKVTQDGGLQWVNMGSSILPWGSPGPTTAPLVTQVTAPSIYPPWAANTWYAPVGAFAFIDSNGNIQQVQGGGGTTKTGSPPTFNASVGGLTNDGSVTWMNLGPAVWQASHNYTLGQSIRVTYTYTTQVYVYVYLHGTFTPVLESQQVTATSMFQVTVAGMSGTSQPGWNNGVGTVTQEPSGLTWRNIGNTTTYPGAAQNISTTPRIIDSNGYFQQPYTQGETGATAPASWATDLGKSTTDNTETWLNAGSYAVAATLPWQWAYSGKNSITGEISNASPLSPPFITSLGNAPVIQGQGVVEPPWDTIVLWRTAAGGSTLLYDDEFPNPGPGVTWIYTDTNLDPGNVASSGHGMLNQFITAPINNVNDPPPANFLPQAYYLTRIWGFTNNVLRWTGGPDTVTGSGNSTMPPVNQFRMPAKGILCWPTSVGLIVFTTSDIWVVLGQGTPTSPFYLVNFQQGIGMASQDAFGVNGSTAYAMLSSHQLVSIDPGAGELEVGFPIADYFDNFMDPSLAYLTWHQGRSADTALYVANGSSYWMRLAAVSAPESGNVWSPAGVIRSPGKVRAMISAEITPGEKVLLVGPHVDGNPILQRDSTVNSDNGVPYPAHGTLAAVVLAQPGATAGVQYVVTEEKMIAGASAALVKMLFDEIDDGDGVYIHGADWRVLRNVTPDPPNLAPQKSIRTQRLWANQDPSTVIRCRFYQQDISWPAEDHPNELYTNTIYGRVPEKARK
jgi:hypothetical protein